MKGVGGFGECVVGATVAEHCFVLMWFSAYSC